MFEVFGVGGGLQEAGIPQGPTAGSQPARLQVQCKASEGPGVNPPEPGSW